MAALCKEPPEPRDPASIRGSFRNMTDPTPQNSARTQVRFAAGFSGHQPTCGMLLEKGSEAQAIYEWASYLISNKQLSAFCKGQLSPNSRLRRLLSCRLILNPACPAPPGSFRSNPPHPSTHVRNALGKRARGRKRLTDGRRSKISFPIAEAILRL